MNPVLLLDEVDKIGADFRGDPSSALLEVLDPAQNHTFRDHYLEVDLDLSRVLFIATANVIDTIPGPLLDRMEVIRLDGYTDNEKVAIARHHLLRPPGQPGRVARGRGRRHRRGAVGTSWPTTPGRPGSAPSSASSAGCCARWRPRWSPARSCPRSMVDRDDVRAWLGRPRFFFEAAEREALPGVATGLAVTGAGGDVLFVEASVSDGPEGLTLTGQLGDVMKESAEIALSFVRSHAAELGIDPGGVRRQAVPPARPGGGGAQGRPVGRRHHDLGAGEPAPRRAGPRRRRDDRRGDPARAGCSPIGGVRQKVLAAHRSGLSEVVLPARNGPDLEDVPEEVREPMTFHLAERVEDVLGPVLGIDFGPVEVGPVEAGEDDQLPRSPEPPPNRVDEALVGSAPAGVVRLGVLEVVGVLEVRR